MREGRDEYRQRGNTLRRQIKDQADTIQAHAERYTAGMLPLGLRQRADLGDADRPAPPDSANDAHEHELTERDGAEDVAPAPEVAPPSRPSLVHKGGERGERPCEPDRQRGEGLARTQSKQRGA